MYQAIKILVIVLIVLYPVSIYFGLNYFTPSQLGLFLLAVFLLRILFFKKQVGQRIWQVLLTVSIGVVLAALTWVFDSEKYLLWYPVGLNIAFFIVFTTSVIFPPTIIETLARSMEKDLPPSGVIYTRNVTVVWAAFFLLNAAIATWTVMIDDMKIWTLYNGLLAYIAMGTLFGIELIIRRHVRGK